jgi:hypothetical protein
LHHGRRAFQHHGLDRPEGGGDGDGGITPTDVASLPASGLSMIDNVFVSREGLCQRTVELYADGHDLADPLLLQRLSSDAACARHT